MITGRVATAFLMLLRRLADSFSETALHLRLFQFLQMLLMMTLLTQLTPFLTNQCFCCLISHLIPAGLSVFVVGPIFQFGCLYNCNAGRTGCLKPGKTLLWIFRGRRRNQYFGLFHNFRRHILSNGEQKKSVHLWNKRTMGIGHSDLEVIDGWFLRRILWLC